MITPIVLKYARMLAKYDEALILACKELASVVGSCPYDMHNWQSYDGCDNKCNPNIAMSECWSDYFKEAAENGVGE